MIQSLSKYKFFPKDKRPSLCGHCLRGGKGFYLNWNDKIYASCSYKHLEKIKERVIKKENLTITIQVNPDSVSKVLDNFKDTYIEYSKKNNTYVFHEWPRTDRQNFFQKFVAYYLSYEEKLADEGL